MLDARDIAAIRRNDQDTSQVTITIHNGWISGDLHFLRGYPGVASRVYIYKNTFYMKAKDTLTLRMKSACAELQVTYVCLMQTCEVT